MVCDDEHGSVSRSHVTTIELEIVCAEVIIVIQLESQAELSNTSQVNKRVGSGIEVGKVPVACLGIVCDESNGWLARPSLEVGQLQINSIAKDSFADVHCDFHMSCKGVGTGQTLLLNLENDLRDDSIIGHGGGVEVQDGAILAIGGTIAEEESAVDSVHCAALIAGLT